MNDEFSAHDTNIDPGIEELWMKGTPASEGVIAGEGGNETWKKYCQIISNIIYILEAFADIN